jgi:hypothetical protein
MKVYTLCSKTHESLANHFLIPSATEAGFLVQVIPTEQICATGFYKEKGWMETMQAKIEMLIRISKEHHDELFIYSDCDVVFNPKNFNPKVATRDFEPSLFLACQNDVVQLCAGFMIMKGGEELEKLLGLVLENIEKYHEDQTALNAVIKIVRAPVRILPDFEYCCIRQLSGTLNNQNIWNETNFEIPQQWKIFHTNWTKGVPMKQKLLEYIYESI